jgi:hypothetical protein
MMGFFLADFSIKNWGILEGNVQSEEVDLLRVCLQLFLRLQKE